MDQHKHISVLTLKTGRQAADTGAFISKLFENLLKKMVAFQSAEIHLKIQQQNKNNIENKAHIRCSFPGTRRADN